MGERLRMCVKERVENGGIVDWKDVLNMVRGMIGRDNLFFRVSS